MLNPTYHPTDTAHGPHPPKTLGITHEHSRIAAVETVVQIPHLADQRQKLILNLLAERGQCRTRELADAMHTSEMTIRRDLQELEERGVLRRVHGGAVLTDEATQAPTAGTAAREHLQRIARRALDLLQPPQVIYLDAGNTSRELAQQLASQPEHAKGCHVVTHSLPIASTLLGKVPSLQIIGGELYPATGGTFGQVALEQIGRFRYDLFFMGAAGVHPETGWTNTNHVEVMIKQAIAARAKQVVALVDSQKWMQTSFAEIMPFDQVHTWVSDGELPPEARRTAERQNIKLLLG